MVEITLNPESPSQAVVKAGNMSVTVTDDNGRQITVKKLNALDRMRLFEVVGSENVSNEAYLGYASLAYHVSAIDGEPVPHPGSKAQLEALVQRLDDAGMNAVGAAVSENFLQAQGDPKDAVKNG